MALNVLVVDDSKIMRAMIIKTLHLCGIPLGAIYQAANAQEGLELLDREWIDIALVDINMPVMTGDEMIDRIRANPDTEGLPVIVVSTEGSEARIAKFHKQGAQFVHKPMRPESLQQSILELIGVTHEQGIEGSGSESVRRSL